MDYDDIVQKFVGKGKVQPLKIEAKNGAFSLKYKEGKKIEEVICEDREALEKILIEFGGKNPETCSAPDMFLELDGKWSSENISELGHRITKVMFSGQHVVRSKTIYAHFPKGSGYRAVMDSKKISVDDLPIKLKDTEISSFTRAFKKPSEFDVLAQWLLTDDTTKDLKWHVSLLGTESRDTNDQCVWKRLKAGDGTKRMVLELIGLNGDHYTDSVRQDLFNAAGDMFYNPCKRVSFKKKTEQFQEICMFAVEDGKVDISRHEPVYEHVET